MSNISKKRKWNDIYLIYKLNKHDIGKFLNTWFLREYYNEYQTVKKVDSETSSFLYNRKYNPVRIGIYLINGLYHMKAQIHSIDDSSFGIWWGESNNYIKLEEVRFNLMHWIDKQKLLNGNEFLNKCIELGADENSKDYN